MTDSRTDDQDLVDRLEEVWASIDSMCANLTDAQWKTPTDLPGWSVQDNVVHISGIESSILGRPAPDHTPPDYDHVKNEVGQRNEVWIDSRRAWPGSKVLDEFREVTGARLEQLRGFTETDFDAESWTPAGPGTVRDLLPFRIFDSWAHEQDIRRAVDQPCDLESPVADLAFERVLERAAVRRREEGGPTRRHDGRVRRVGITPDDDRHRGRGRPGQADVVSAREAERDARDGRPDTRVPGSRSVGPGGVPGRGPGDDHRRRRARPSRSSVR